MKQALSLGKSDLKTSEEKMTLIDMLIHGNHAYCQVDVAPQTHHQLMAPVSLVDMVQESQ